MKTTTIEVNNLPITIFYNSHTWVIPCDAICTAVESGGWESPNEYKVLELVKVESVNGSDNSELFQAVRDCVSEGAYQLDEKMESIN